MIKIRRAAYDWGVVYVSETASEDGLFAIHAELLFGGSLKYREASESVRLSIQSDAEKVVGLLDAGKPVTSEVIKVPVPSEASIQ